MNFDTEKAKGLAMTVATKANGIVLDLNDRFEALSDEVRVTVLVALTAAAFILFSTGWAITTAVALVAFRLYASIMERFAPNAFVAEAVETPAADVVDIDAKKTAE